MNTYTQTLYQIVFGTRCRRNILLKENRAELFKYISGILASNACHLYQINGVENHIHIVTHLHPPISLSSLVKDIKLVSSHYIKKRKLFPKFQGWQGGYSAFTYSIEAGLCIRLRNESLKWLLDRHSRRLLQRKHSIVMVSRKNRSSA